MAHRTVRWLVGLILLAVFSSSVGAVTAQADVLQERYDQIERETSDIRDLPIVTPINVTFKSSDQLRAELQRDVDSDYPAAERERDERILQAFGLAPASLDLGTLYVDLYSEQVAGYYDSETSEMVVIRPQESGDDLQPSEEITYAHEVVHALQDQNLNLDSRLESSEDTSDDEALASLALIEGDAVVAQTEYLTSKPGLMLRLSAEFMTSEIPTDQLDAAPPIIRESLLFPYSEGAAFVGAVREQGGWAGVDQAHATPPTSTEQILHPEKFLSGEQPVIQDIPDIAVLLGPDWQEIDDNNFGEFQMRVLLSGQSDSAQMAEGAAAGWDGDRFRIVARAAETAVVWRSSWDTPEDAAEFGEALARYEVQRWNAERQTDGPRLVIEERDGGSVSMITVDGLDVTYVLAEDRATADLLLSGLEA